MSAERDPEAARYTSAAQQTRHPSRREEEIEGACRCCRGCQDAPCAEALHGEGCPRRCLCSRRGQGYQGYNRDPFALALAAEE